MSLASADQFRELVQATLGRGKTIAKHLPDWISIMGNQHSLRDKCIGVYSE